MDQRARLKVLPSTQLRNCSVCLEVTRRKNHFQHVYRRALCLKVGDSCVYVYTLIASAMFSYPFRSAQLLSAQLNVSVDSCVNLFNQTAKLHCRCCLSREWNEILFSVVFSWKNRFTECVLGLRVNEWNIFGYF